MPPALHCCATTPERSIRHLLTILVSLLAATALALGGYGVLLDLRRDPITTGDAASMPAPLFEIADPTRLERLREVAPASAQLGFQSRATGRLAIELTGLADESLPATAGVAVIARDTEAQLAWLPLSGFTRSADTLQAEVDVPAQPLRVTFSGRPTAALRSFWTAGECTAIADKATSMRLDCAVYPVTVVTVLPEQLRTGHRVPFTLRRADDPDWHYTAADGGVAVAADDRGQLQLLLGAGDYRLTPLADANGAPFALRVPAAGTVQAEFTR